jgi:hypothetical protein
MSVQIGASPKIVILENPTNPTKKDIEELIELITQMITGLPATEIYFGENAPSNPTVGDLWYKPSENRLYAYAT